MTETSAPKLIRPKINKMLSAIAVLSFIAMGVTAYLTYLHYAPEAAEFCNFNEKFNCDIVNKSPWSYAEIGSVEIPVAIMGFVTYTIIFFGSLGVLKRWKFQKIHKKLREGVMVKLLSWLTYVGLVFCLYLTYIEAFKLFTFCLFCLIQQVLIIAIAVLFFVIGRVIHSAKKTSTVCEFC